MRAGMLVSGLPVLQTSNAIALHRIEDHEES